MAIIFPQDSQLAPALRATRPEAVVVAARAAVENAGRSAHLGASGGGS